MFIYIGISDCFVYNIRWINSYIQKDKSLQRTYENKNKVKFNLEIVKADVPKEADYFGFLIKTKVENEDSIYEYKALVKKAICPDEQKALDWLSFIGLNFLYEILDTYENGKTLLLFPCNNDGNWYIL